MATQQPYEPTGKVSRRGLLGIELTLLVAACTSLPVGPVVQQVLARALNPDVNQDTIPTTICRPGYAVEVRPSTSYTNGVKAKLMRGRGLVPELARDYEFNHMVPLALAGHPRALENLALQHWEGADGTKRPQSSAAIRTHTATAC